MESSSRTSFLSSFATWDPDPPLDDELLDDELLDDELLDDELLDEALLDDELLTVLVESESSL